MDILVTGASGRLGKHLMPALLEQHKNDNITVFSRTSCNLNGIKEVHGDLKSLVGYKKELGEFDLIIWLASKISYSDDYGELFSTNVKPLEIALELYPEAAIVYVSSISVYGFLGRFDESSVVKPATYYGVSKVEAEQIVKKFNTWQILRPSIIIGSGYGDGFSAVYDLLSKGNFAYIGDRNTKLPFVHPKDVASAVMFSKERALNSKKDLFNVSQADVTQKEIVEFVCRTSGFGFPKHSVPAGLVKLVAPKKYHHLVDQLSKSREISAEKIIKHGFEFKQTWQQGAVEVVEELQKQC